MNYFKKLYQYLFKRKTNNYKKYLILEESSSALPPVFIYRGYIDGGMFDMLTIYDNINFDDFIQIEVDPNIADRNYIYLNKRVKFYKTNHQLYSHFFKMLDGNISVITKGGEVIINYEKYGESITEDHTSSNLDLI